MRWTKAIFAAAAAFLAVSAKAEIETDEDVLVLTEDNFEEAVSSHDLLLVEFYAPWCGHCKALAPEYAKAAGILKEDGISIAKVDATEHRGLGEKYGIQGFPTLKLMKGDKVSDYNGGRKAQDIVDFMKKRAGPVAVDVSNVAELKAFTEANPTGVVGYVSGKDSEDGKLFLSIADGDEKNVYAITTDAGAAKEAGLSDTGSLIITSEEGKFTLAFADMESEDIEKWMFGHSLPLFLEYSQEKAGSIFGGAINVHTIAFFDDESDDFEKQKATMLEVGAEFRTESVFIYIPKSENRILSVFDLTEDDVPALCIADMRGGSMKKFIYEGELNAKDISAWEKSFFDGELKPKLKSAEPKPEDLEGDVKVVTGKSFNEIVVDNTNDVLVEFYAPWCGHCKSLEPKYNELGALYAGIDTVTIAKMDATENEVDHPGVDVTGFPTLLFFPGNDKQNVVPYKGAREVEALSDFIVQTATNKVDVSKFDFEEDDSEHDEL